MSILSQPIDGKITLAQAIGEAETWLGQTETTIEKSIAGDPAVQSAVNTVIADGKAALNVGAELGGNVAIASMACRTSPHELARLVSKYVPYLDRYGGRPVRRGCGHRDLPALGQVGVAAIQHRGGDHCHRLGLDGGGAPRQPQNPPTARSNPMTPIDWLSGSAAAGDASVVAGGGGGLARGASPAHRRSGGRPEGAGRARVTAVEALKVSVEGLTRGIEHLGDRLADSQKLSASELGRIADQVAAGQRLTDARFDAIRELSARELDEVKHGVRNIRQALEAGQRPGC